jgi:hypothetical protein
VNMVQKMCTHVSQCKYDTCWNYSRNWGRRRWRRMVKEVNSCVIYLIHCKNLCKGHNVPPPSKTIKEKRKYKNSYNRDLTRWSKVCFWQSKYSKERCVQGGDTSWFGDQEKGVPVLTVSLISWMTLNMSPNLYRTWIFLLLLSGKRGGE